MDSKTKVWLHALSARNKLSEAEQQYQQLVGTTLEHSMNYMSHTALKKVNKIRQEYDMKTDEEIVQHLKKKHNSVLVRDRLRRKLASGAPDTSK